LKIIFSGEFDVFAVDGTKHLKEKESPEEAKKMISPRREEKKRKNDATQRQKG
jgi:hypothetical protein